MVATPLAVEQTAKKENAGDKVSDNLTREPQAAMLVADPLAATSVSTQQPHSPQILLYDSV